MAYVIVIKLNYYYPSDYPISCCPLLKFRSFEIIIILFFIFFNFQYVQLCLSRSMDYPVV